MTRRQAVARERNRSHRQRERDCTARPVIRQLVEATIDELDDLGLLPRHRPLEALDGWAGAGPWSSELRIAMARRGLHVRIVAVELDAGERIYLRRWADAPIIGDVMRVLDVWRGDLVLGNPAFSSVVPDFKRRSADRWPPECTPVPKILAAAPAGLLLHRHDMLCRGAGGQWIADNYPPARVFDVAGSVAFRAGIDPERDKAWGADQYSYSGFLWIRGHRGPWRQSVLPALPAEDRKWVHRPGAEPDHIIRRLGLIEAPRN